MTWWLWILAILFSLLIPSPTGDDGISGIGWEVVSVDGIEGVIVPEWDADRLISRTYPDLAGDVYWTPTVADIEAAETAIAAEQGALTHRRQYAGFTENGARNVYVNGFCEGFDSKWTTQPVRVEDGGACYFTAIYSVDGDKLEMFRFNGEA